MTKMSLFSIVKHSIQRYAQRQFFSISFSSVPISLIKKNSHVIHLYTFKTLSTKHQMFADLFGCKVLLTKEN